MALKPQVAPDINSVKMIDGCTSVRGYQNYDIDGDYIDPQDLGHSWANSFYKFHTVMDVIDTLEGVKTYADLGCNMGMYVFANRMDSGFESTGYDFETKYIDVCNQINDEYGFGCTFSSANFSAVDEKYDLVTALGLIHHLYHHTEEYGNLSLILDDLAEMTNKYLILEFPTEKDPKARKWVNMEGRVNYGEYSERLLLEFANKRFSSVTSVERVHPDRPIFLMVK